MKEDSLKIDKKRLKQKQTDEHSDKPTDKNSTTNPQASVCV